jgi:hypothetical protein
MDLKKLGQDLATAAQDAHLGDETIKNYKEIMTFTSGSWFCL